MELDVSRRCDEWNVITGHVRSAAPQTRPGAGWRLCHSRHRLREATPRLPPQAGVRRRLPVPVQGRRESSSRAAGS